MRLPRVHAISRGLLIPPWTPENVRLYHGGNVLITIVIVIIIGIMTSTIFAIVDKQL